MFFGCLARLAARLQATLQATLCFREHYTKSSVIWKMQSGSLCVSTVVPVRLASAMSPSATVQAALSFHALSNALSESADSSPVSRLRLREQERPRHLSSFGIIVVKHDCQVTKPTALLTSALLRSQGKELRDPY